MDENDQGTNYPRRNTRPLLFWFFMLLTGFVLWTMTGNGERKIGAMPNSVLLQQVADGEIQHVAIDGGKVLSTNRKNEKLRTFMSADIQELLRLLREKNVPYEVHEPAEISPWIQMLLPVALIVGMFWLFGRASRNAMQQMQGGVRNMTGNRSKRHLVQEKNAKTFADVIGMDEVIDDVRDVVHYLEDPARFFKMGARLPRGLLLTGKPGCGKTLLARAIAGEAKVPFFSISGSDFVEMFVGVGAGRVRSLFQDATRHGKAIIFIDEIDAVGRHRGSGMGGGHDEREQTLNQLLVEMDGFEARSGVVLIAATNRPDVLDPALLRPGRFDRQVEVIPPDTDSREKILQLYAKDKPVAPEVNFRDIAKITSGMTGAGLSTLMNEAALLATRERADAITMVHLHQAIDKVIMGGVRKNLVLTPFERELTAVHEVGHAVTAHLTPYADPIRKVSIIPRGQALGVTLTAPQEDQRTYSGNQLKAKIKVLYGGIVAEEMFLAGDHTTGPSDDLKRITQLATLMVTKWGFGIDESANRIYHDRSSVLRPVFGSDDDGGGGHSEYSAHRIDDAVQRLLGPLKGEVKRLLTEHRAQSAALIRTLLAKETIEVGEMDEVLGLKTVPEVPKLALAID